MEETKQEVEQSEEIQEKQAIEEYATAVLDLICDTYAEKNLEPRTYEAGSTDYKVFSGNGADWEALHELASRQDDGDSSFSVQVESILGSMKFDYKDEWGYKFMFTRKRRTGIEVHFGRARSAATPNSQTVLERVKALKLNMDKNNQ